MGAGIAQLCLEAGFATVGCDLDVERGAAAQSRIAHFLGRKVEKGRLDVTERDEALALLEVTTETARLAGCDAVIEAVFEDLAVKQAVFEQLDRLCVEATFLASNTSALAVGDVATVTARPERVVGMHFFNPAPLMPLVEIVRTARSSDEAVAAAESLAVRLGRQPIRCADTPGFVVNRVLIPLLNDCVRVLDETGVTPDDLDRALTLGAGWPLGPCALLDLIGLDVHVHASEQLAAATGEERMRPPERLVELASAGRLGRKSGEGFYRYE